MGRIFEWRYRLSWLRGEIAAILAMLGVGGLLSGLAWYVWASRTVPSQTEFATVVHFGHRDSKTGVYPLVVVRMNDGAERQLMTGTRNTLVHCRKGSIIRLVRKGNALFVDPRGCGRVSADVPGAPIPSTAPSGG